MPLRLPPLLLRQLSLLFLLPLLLRSILVLAFAPFTIS
jgi:hypothetical protein